MHVTRLLIVAAHGLVVGLLAPSITRAGYVTAIEVHSLAVFESDGCSTGLSSTLHSPPAQTEHLPFWLLGVAFGQPQSQTGAQNTGSPSMTGGTPVVAIMSDTSSSTSAQLVMLLWLGRKVWLPPRFLSGIFRPPRHAP